MFEYDDAEPDYFTREEVEQHVTEAAQQTAEVYRIALRVAELCNAPASVVLKAFDESKHPRDHGKFSSKPGAKGDGDENDKLPEGHELASKPGRDLKTGGLVRRVSHGGRDYVVKRSANKMEAVASDLAQIAGVRVPRAHITDDGAGNKVLVQEAAEGQSLDKLGDHNAARAALSKVAPEEIDRHVLFDYLLGNTDVHRGNYMVTEDGALSAIDKEMILGRGNLKGQNFEPSSLLELGGHEKEGMLRAFGPETVRAMAAAGHKMAEHLEANNMRAEARQVRDRAHVLDKLAEQPKPTAGALYKLGSEGVTPPNLGLLGRVKWHLTKGVPVDSQTLGQLESAIRSGDVRAVLEPGDGLHGDGDGETADQSGGRETANEILPSGGRAETLLEMSGGRVSKSLTGTAAGPTDPPIDDDDDTDLNRDDGVVDVRKAAALPDEIIDAALALIEGGEHPADVAELLAERLPHGKAWEESKHKRDHGKFSSTGGSGAAAENRKKDSGGNKPGKRALKQAKRSEAVTAASALLKQRAAGKPLDAGQARELLEHLGHLTHDDLKALRKEHGAAFGGERVKGGRVANLVKWAKNELGARRRAKQGSALQQVVDYGGIDPQSADFKRFYGSMKDAVNDGIPMAAFKRGGNGLDEIAAQMVSAGHINLPDWEDPSEHLMGLLRGRRMLNWGDEDKKHEDAYAEHVAGMPETGEKFDPNKEWDDEDPDWFSKATDHTPAELLAAAVEVAQRARDNGTDPEDALDALHSFGMGGTFGKAWDSAKHPRGDDGRFIKVSDIKAAKKDPAKAKELRAKVTNPEERKKLDHALHSDELSGSTRDVERHHAQVKREKVQANRAVAKELRKKLSQQIVESPTGEVDPDDARALIPHLSTMTHAELSDVRKLLDRAGASFGGKRLRADRVAALVAWAESQGKPDAQVEPEVKPEAESGSGAGTGETANDLKASDYRYSEPTHVGGDVRGVTAHDPRTGEKIGHIHYALNGDTIQVSHVEVDKDHRRRGIASELYRRMQADHPGKKVGTALRTADGEKFRAAWDARNPDAVGKPWYAAPAGAAETGAQNLPGGGLDRLSALQRMDESGRIDPAAVGEFAAQYKNSSRLNEVAGRLLARMTPEQRRQAADAHRAALGTGGEPNGAFSGVLSEHEPAKHRQVREGALAALDKIASRTGMSAEQKRQFAGEIAAAQGENESRLADAVYGVIDRAKKAPTGTSAAPVAAAAQGKPPKTRLQAQAERARAASPPPDPNAEFATPREQYQAFLRYAHPDDPTKKPDPGAVAEYLSKLPDGAREKLDQHFAGHGKSLAQVEAFHRARMAEATPERVPPAQGQPAAVPDGRPVASGSGAAPAAHLVGDTLTYTGRAGSMPAEFRGYHTDPGTGEKMARVIVRPISGPPFEASVKPSELSKGATGEQEKQGQEAQVGGNVSGAGRADGGTGGAVATAQPAQEVPVPQASQGVGKPAGRFVSVRKNGRTWDVHSVHNDLNALKDRLGLKHFDTQTGTWVKPGARGPVKDKNARVHYDEVPQSLDHLVDPTAFKTVEQMRQQFARSDDTFTEHDQRGHYNAVKNALALGKPVPPAVLADYPDLAAKYGQTGSGAAPTPTGTSAAPSLAALKKNPKADIEHLAALQKRHAEGSPEWETLDMARDNASHVGTRDNSALAALHGKDDRHGKRHFVLERLASAAAASEPAGAKAAHDAIASLGGKLDGPAVGATIPHDASQYDGPEGAFTGDAVKVARQPVTYNGALVYRGKVEPVSGTAAATGVDTGGAGGDTTPTQGGSAMNGNAGGGDPPKVPPVASGKPKKSPKPNVPAKMPNGWANRSHQWLKDNIKAKYVTPPPKEGERSIVISRPQSGPEYFHEYAKGDLIHHPGGYAKQYGLEQEWLTPEVSQIAQSIMHTSDESTKDAQMPKLAAALERAGCTNAEALSSLRQSKREGWVGKILSVAPEHLIVTAVKPGFTRSGEGYKKWEQIANVRPATPEEVAHHQLHQEADDLRFKLSGGVNEMEPPNAPELRARLAEVLKRIG